MLGPSDPAVIELSELLRSLDIHPSAARSEKFRGPKSIGMKLANIRGADPTREGGFLREPKTDDLSWDRMGGNEGQLLAKKIDEQKKVYKAPKRLIEIPICQNHYIEKDAVLRAWHLLN